MDEKVDVISRCILLLLLLYWCCPGKRPNLVWKVTKQKEKKRHKRGREMKMKSLKSDMHTWHAQTLSTCANILKQIFRHHLPLSRGADWFTQMLLLSLSLWCEQLKVKAQWDSVTSLSDSWDRSEVSQGLKCSVWFCQMNPRWFYNTWWNLLAFPFISMAVTQLEKICHHFFGANQLNHKCYYGCMIYRD